MKTVIFKDWFRHVNDLNHTYIIIAITLTFEFLTFKECGLKAAFQYLHKPL